MGLKSFIEKHPLPIIVSVIIGTAIVVGGIVKYFEGKEKTQITEKYIAEIQELKFKLSSIERKIGDDKEYFDVNNLLIKQQDARRLPQKYKPYSKGAILVSVPDDDSWYFEDTNKYQFVKQLYGEDCDRIIEGDKKKKLYRNTRLLVWRKHENFLAKLNHRDSNNPILPLKINYFPSLTVQVFPFKSVHDLGIEYSSSPPC